MLKTDGHIIALMPTYNEVAHIARVVQGVMKYVPVVVIDDGSTDGSGAAAEAAGATLIWHGQNRGKGAALNTGFDYAVSQGVDAAITIDADGQHDPDEIPLFIDAFGRGVGDIIIGRRTHAQMPGIRQVGNRLGGWLLGKAMGQAVPDNQSGYRLFARPVLEQIRPTTTRFEAEVEILLRAQLAGFRIGWVPIRTIYADEVSHYHKLRDSILFLKMIRRIWLARRRGSFE